MIEWYVKCLQDVNERKTVRGLAEAEAGYRTAIRELYWREKGV